MFLYFVHFEQETKFPVFLDLLCRFLFLTLIKFLYLLMFPARSPLLSSSSSLSHAHPISALYHLFSFHHSSSVKARRPCDAVVTCSWKHAKTLMLGSGFIITQDARWNAIRPLTPFFFRQEDVGHMRNYGAAWRIVSVALAWWVTRSPVWFFFFGGTDEWGTNPP